MPTHPIWTGAIAFGLVRVPVSLVSSYSHKGIEFRLLHATCGTRIKYGRHCPYHKTEVPWEQVKRAYEYRKGKYVVIEESDFEKIDPKLSRTIEVAEFVDTDVLDPIFVANVYHLAPEKTAAKAYVLLRDALARAGKIALAKMIMKEKEHWVAVRVSGEALQLVDLHYADELKSVASLGIPKKTKISATEMSLALKIIQSLSRPFNPKKYRDEYEEKLMRLVTRKAKGQKIVTPPTLPEVKVKDLMDALEKSMAAEPRRAVRKKR